MTENPIRVLSRAIAPAILAAATVSSPAAADNPRTMSGEEIAVPYQTMIVLNKRLDPPGEVWVDKGNAAVLSRDNKDREIDILKCVGEGTRAACITETVRLTREAFREFKVGQSDVYPTDDQRAKSKDSKPIGPRVEYDTVITAIGFEPAKGRLVDRGDHAAVATDDADHYLKIRKKLRIPGGDVVFSSETIDVKKGAFDEFRVGERGVYPKKSQIDKRDSDPQGEFLFPRD